MLFLLTFDFPDFYSSVMSKRCQESHTNLKNDFLWGFIQSERVNKFEGFLVIEGYNTVFMQKN